MPRSKQPALPASVRRLGERIERWRRTRARRTEMPAELWAEATELARQGRAHAIAKALRINFEGLKRRMAESAPAVEVARPAEFIEWPGAQILAGGVTPGPVIEMSDTAGTRLVVRLGTTGELDVARLVSAFRGGGG